jgi:uncharacterized iron-regulated membrane protein
MDVLYETLTLIPAYMCSIDWEMELGLPGRIVVSIAGLTPLALYVTGLIRWLQKRKAAWRAKGLSRKRLNGRLE